MQKLSIFYMILLLTIIISIVFPSKTKAMSTHYYITFFISIRWIRNVFSAEYDSDEDAEGDDGNDVEV